MRVLSDADKRAKYDQFGFAGVDPSYGGSAGAGGFGGFDMGDLGDVRLRSSAAAWRWSLTAPQSPQRGESIRADGHPLVRRMRSAARRRSR